MAKDQTGRPPTFKTAEELEAVINAYFEECKPVPMTYEKGGEMVVMTDKAGNPVYSENPPTIAGLAYRLGFASRQSVYDYEWKNERFSYVVKRARLLIEEFHEKRLSTAMFPTGSIFWAKNHGWSDRQRDEVDDALLGTLDKVINTVKSELAK